MTVNVKIGRRIPRNWFKRQAVKAKGLLSFQENIWIMIKQSMELAKKKAHAAGTLEFSKTMSQEIENLHYQFEWIEIVIRGTIEQEQEEYNDTLKLYDSLGSILKKELPKDDNLSKHFKTKKLNIGQVSEAYEKGYGATKDKSMASKLLEMGILTHVELIKDHDIRNAKPDILPDSEET